MLKVIIIIIFLVKILCKRQLLETEIPNCISYAYSPNRSNQFYVDVKLCVECKEGYVVSKSFKQCIEFRYQLLYWQFGNCMRIAYDGSCAEAIRGIELLPNNQYVHSQDLKFSDRCAIVSEDYLKCLYPRFGFKLDMKSNQLQKDTEMSFCAIFDSLTQKCIEFQRGFVRIDDTEIGAYIGENCVNCDKILASSTTSSLLCEPGYESTTKYEIKYFFDLIKIPLIDYIGCIQGSYTGRGDLTQRGCALDALTFGCSWCVQGQAVSDNYDSCQVVIPNCFQYSRVQNINVCIKCYSCFKLTKQQCIYMNGCQTVRKDDPNLILTCLQFYKLENGICVINSEALKTLNQQKDVDINDNNSYKFTLGMKCNDKSFDECYFCEEQQYYYYDEKEDRCIERFFSKNCAHPALNRDICLSFVCIFNSTLNINMVNDLDLKNFQTIQYLQFISDSLTNGFQQAILHETDIQKIFHSLQEFEIKINSTTKFCQEMNEQQKSYNHGNYYSILNLNYFYTRPHLKIVNMNTQYQFFTYNDQQENNFVIPETRIENCIKSDNEQKICFVCEEGYYYFSPTNSCVFKINDCFIHSKVGTCFKCLIGFSLNEDKTKCSPICPFVVVKKKSIYYHSFFSQSTTDTSECKESQIPCLKYIDDICAECFEGYVLDKTNSYQCIPDTQFQNCKIIDNYQSILKEENEKHSLKRQHCIECKDNYKLYKGYCFCQLQQCLRAYKCENDECFKQSSSIFKDVLNLKSNIYLEKMDDYYKVVSCQIEHCAICDEGGICLFCVFGYIYDSQVKKCLFNDNQVILNNINLSSVDDGCLKKENNSQRCKTCQKYLYLMINDGLCYLECPETYQKQQLMFGFKGCFSCPENCLGCYFDIKTDQIVCRNCDVGFYLYPDEFTCLPFCMYFIETKKGLHCVQACTEYTKGRYCLDSCDNFYMKKEGKKVCVDTCNYPLYAHEDQFLCSHSCNKGYVSDNNNICRRCQVPNCLYCSLSQLDQCYQCEEDHVLINGICYITCNRFKPLFIALELKDCEEQINSYCLKSSEVSIVKCLECFPGFVLSTSSSCDCFQGTYINHQTKSCEKCRGDICSECDNSQNCVRCSKGYKLIQFLFGFQISSYCTKQCPIGYFEKEDTQNSLTLLTGKSMNVSCERCSLGCLRCDHKNKCLECTTQFELQTIKVLQQGKDNQYSIVEISICKCKQNLEINEESCKYQCDLMKTVNNPQECCRVFNCEICIQDYTVCNKCKQETPYLFLNTCLKECPSGTYIEKETNLCKKCQSTCNTCENEPNNCKSCVLPSNLVDNDNSCKCIRGMNFFKNNCYQTCPIFTTVIVEDRLCKQYCEEYKTLPVFDSYGNFETCEADFNHPDSKFCEQNLFNMSRFIRIDNDASVTEQNQNNIKLMILIYHTPIECYQYRLRGRNSSELPIQTSEENRNYDFDQSFLKLESRITIDTLRKKKDIECDEQHCYLYLDIFLKENLSQTIKLKITIKTRVIEIEGVKVQNSSINKIINIDQIQNKQILSSSSSISCNKVSQCSFNSILTQISAPIKIEIFPLILLSENAGADLIMYPLQLQIQSESVNNTRSIAHDYYYDNSQPSIIKLIVYINEVMEGDLLVILRVYNYHQMNSQVSYFNLSNQQQQYIITKTKIEVTEKAYEKFQNYQKEESNIFSSKYLIILNTVVSMIVLIVIILKCFKIFNKKQPLLNEQNEESQQRNSTAFEEYNDSMKIIEVTHIKDQSQQEILTIQC